jgi:hypothetical protein
MTGTTIEYFATSEVLVLMFDNSNDSPLSEMKASPMKSQRQTQSRVPQVRRINASSPNQPRKVKRQAVSSSLVDPQI